jgi:hypothetical protein
LRSNPLKKIKEDFLSPAIELYMDKRLVITDCEGVIDYSENGVVLCLGEKNLRVYGSDLMVNSFCYGQTDITGNITSIEFV